MDSLQRIGILKNDIIGIHSVPKSEAFERELIRILKTNGMRIDLTCFVTCDDSIAAYHWEKQPLNENEIKSYNFWFVAINALGKLMRKDYLISSHLAHMLIMEGLVIQMQLRDKEYETNIHRYGYAENLEYLEIFDKGVFGVANTEDHTYNYITQMIYSALVTYEKLMPKLDKGYRCQLSNFLEIWHSYVDERA